MSERLAMSNSSISPSVFSRIISGEFPGRFVYQDDLCVAFLSIHPLQPGHTLVVPRQQIDHWLDLDPSVYNHLSDVARRIGQAQMQVFKPVKIGLMLAGLEVPHVHIHVVPINAPNDLDFSKVNLNATAEELDQAANSLKEVLGNS